MNSICIKINNTQVVNYLLEKFENIKLDNIYISIRKFKHYNNIILHCKNAEYNLFYNYVSNILSKTIIHFYENELIKSNINLNYFYFNIYEKKKIFDNVLELLKDSNIYDKRYDYINNKIYEFLSSNNHSIYLQALIDFNLKSYHSFLSEQIDVAVNKFLIDKEYIEFVNILRLYIKSESKTSNIEHLHLIYKDKTSIIVDDNKNIISYEDNINKAKYISDISFSSNDYALNALLNLLPKRLTIHVIDNYCDEFINTLKLIFQEKIIICEECEICNMYKRKELKK